MLLGNYIRKINFSSKRQGYFFSPNKGNQRFSQYLNKKFIGSVIILALGVSMLPISYLLSTSTTIRRKTLQIETEFSEILLEVKGNCEDHFDEILMEMNNNPLDGLIPDKMPTSEEIFFSEWANDWFPEIHIPLIGNLIESNGAEMVGDINIDGQHPEADLNISSHLMPSSLIQRQCCELWNPNNTYSLVTTNPIVWFNLAEGLESDREIVKINFNLTNFQLDLISTWVNTSINGWMKNLAEEEIIVSELNLILFGGLLSAGVALLGVGAKFLYSEFTRQKATDKKNNSNKKILVSRKPKTKDQEK